MQFYSIRLAKSVPPGFSDSAIAEFIAISRKLHNFHKNAHIFVIAADFPQILGLDVSCDVIAMPVQSNKLCFSVPKMEWTALCSLHVRFTRAELDKRTESRTNPCYSFGLHGTDRLSAWTGATGCSRSLKAIIHSAERYSEESSRIHRIQAFKFGTEFC